MKKQRIDLIERYLATITDNNKRGGIEDIISSAALLQNASVELEKSRNDNALLRAIDFDYDKLKKKIDKEISSLSSRIDMMLKQINQNETKLSINEDTRKSETRQLADKLSNISLIISITSGMVNDTVTQRQRAEIEEIKNKIREKGEQIEILQKKLPAIVRGHFTRKEVNEIKSTIQSVEDIGKKEEFDDPIEKALSDVIKTVNAYPNLKGGQKRDINLLAYHLTKYESLDPEARKAFQSFKQLTKEFEHKRSPAAQNLARLIKALLAMLVVFAPIIGVPVAVTLHKKKSKHGLFADNPKTVPTETSQSMEKLTKALEEKQTTPNTTPK